MSARPVISVLTVRFSKFFFFWKGMTPNTYLLYFLFVCLSVFTSGQIDKIGGLCQMRSNSPIFKILFFCGTSRKSNTYRLYFCLSVCPSVRTDGQTDKIGGLCQMRSNSPIFKIIFCGKGRKSKTYQ